MVRKGERLKADAEPELLDQLQVSEVTTQLTPSQSVAQEFYRHWVGHVQTTPTKAELAFADELLDRYGQAQVLKMLPGVVQTMKQHFPRPSPLMQPVDTSRPRMPTLNAERLPTSGLPARSSNTLRNASTRPDNNNGGPSFEQHWQILTAAEREGIRQYVLSTASKSMKLEKMTALLHSFCLDELGRRLDPPAGTDRPTFFVLPRFSSYTTPCDNTYKTHNTSTSHRRIENRVTKPF